MRQSEKYIKEILNKDIQISDTVERRIQDTYKMLEKKKYQGRNKLCVAAAIAVICIALPGVVYASAKTEFFQGVFGNETKKSYEATRQEFEDGKGGKFSATVPSKEFVSVDTEKAEEIVGKWVESEPIEKKIGSHMLRIENFAYDKNGALVYFTLEREGGVTALKGNEQTNAAKGAMFTEESDFYFYYETSKGIIGYENTYVDTEKSTDEKLYCYAYVLWNGSLENGDTPQLVIDTYPCEKKDLPENAKITTEKIKLTDKEPIPVKCIDLGEKGYLEYSPISLSVDMAKGMGLSDEEASDPYYLEKIEITYKDGNNYVVSDKKKNIENNGYVMGDETWFKVMFNRLVDTSDVETITVNNVKFRMK